MTTYGVTGHSKLDEPTKAKVYDALTTYFRPRPSGELHGVTCLARGADQIFAQVISDLGGTFDVVLPAQDYRTEIVKPENAVDFDRLLALARAVTTLPFEHSNRDAYRAAGDEVLARCAHLVAVWDGQAVDGRGGTGDTVESARTLAIPVTVIWPEGARRL